MKKQDAKPEKDLKEAREGTKLPTSLPQESTVSAKARGLEVLAELRPAIDRIDLPSRKKRHLWRVAECIEGLILEIDRLEKLLVDEDG